MALVSGVITGLLLKLPFMQQIKKEEEFFEDDLYWMLPKDSSENKELSNF